MSLNLDIGCGTKDEFIEGDWVRIDAYSPDAQVKASILALPYQDNEVDEVWTSHTLEHLHKREIVPALKEIQRVLKPSGKLTVQVPDLVWCCQWWLDHQTTGWDLDIIFGGQSREGEDHLTGFNQKIMVNYLREAGFSIIKADEVFNHSQNTLRFECIK